MKSYQPTKDEEKYTSSTTHNQSHSQQAGSSTGPSLNNNVTHDNKTTDTQTLMHLIKANIGTGVLAMPLAFKNVGLLAGLVLTPIMGLITTYCMNSLIDCHNYLCDRFNYESLDYDQVAALGFVCGPKIFRKNAKLAAALVVGLIFFSQIGFCCVFVTFVIDNLHLSMLNLFNVSLSPVTYMYIIFPIVSLTSSTSNLRYLSFISIPANVLQISGLLLIFVEFMPFMTHALPLHNSGNATIHENSSSNYQITGPIKVEAISSTFLYGLPFFFSTSIYAFEGVNILLPLIKEMKHPDRISGPAGVLNTSMWLMILLYVSMGFFGYIKYGQHVQGSITLNLPRNIISELVRLFYATAIMLSFSIQFYVPWTIVWPLIDEALFYSYRPRPPRDKLQILDTMSAKNQWHVERFTNSTENTTSSQQQLREGNDGVENFPNVSSIAVHDTLHGNSSNLHQQQNKFKSRDTDLDSNASTLGTSYATSTQHHQQVLNPFYQIDANNSKRGPTLAPISGYGSIAPANISRNRLEDVLEVDSNFEDELPEVHWRPPPSQMRGKRRVVRFSVVVFFVAMCFTVSAMVPRVDLVISLVGALAASSLSITIPASIELATFWNYEKNTDDDDDLKDMACNGESQAFSSLKSLNKNSSLGKRIYKKLRWYVFFTKNVCLITLGVLGLLTGTWQSMSNIVKIWIH